MTEQRTIVERSFAGAISEDEITAFLDHALAFNSMHKPREIAVSYDTYRRWHPGRYRDVPVIFDPDLRAGEIVRIIFDEG